MKHAPEKFGEKLRLSLDEKVSIEKIVIELPSGWNKLDNEEVGWVFGEKYRAKLMVQTKRGKILKFQPRNLIPTVSKKYFTPTEELNC